MEQINFQRECPSCGVLINYTSKYNMNSAEKKKSKCKSCGIKSSITEDRKKKMSENIRGQKNPMFGMYKEKNPFYGKKHSEDTKNKIRQNKDYSVYKTEEFREKISLITKGDKNPMFGKSVYNVWVEKYGTEIADTKLKQFKIKQSENSSGEKNSMYGRPSPNGSGNGWSGWYNGWFFRSILELSYMINVIEKHKLVWESAENEKYSIMYIDYLGKNRTYRADFIISGKYLVELKPRKLWDSLSIKLKTQAAKKFCEENNMIYKIRDVPRISTEEILYMIKTDKIKLTNRYNEKLKNWNLS